jgi:hypothetical protein
VSFAEILPLAFVMIAGPQIVSAFFLATSERWASTSLAYVAGAGIAVTVLVSIGYFAGKGTESAAGSGHKGTAGHIIDWVVLVLILFLVVRVYLTRHTTKPPKWMSKLRTAAPKFAFGLGVGLLGVFPTDIVSGITAGLRVARQNDPWWQCLPFVALTLLFLAMPSLAVVLLGKHAHTILPKIRDWMTRDAWVISEIVLVFFAALTVNSLVRG